MIGTLPDPRACDANHAPWGIRVNAIAPGPIRTPLSMSNHTAAQTQAYLDMIPLKRYGEMDEVARAALFLASDDADYITGHVLNVDGGMNEAGLMFDTAELRSYANRGEGQDPR